MIIKQTLKEFVKQVLLQEKWFTSVSNENVYRNPSAREFKEASAVMLEPKGVLNLDNGDIYIWSGHLTHHDDVQKIVMVPNALALYINIKRSVVEVSATTYWSSRFQSERSFSLEEIEDAVKNNRRLKILLGNFATYNDYPHEFNPEQLRGLQLDD